MKPTDAAPPAAKKPRAKKSKPEPVFTRVLARFDYTDREKIELGTEAGRLNQEINSVTEDAKSAGQDFKSRIDAKKAALNAVSNKLTSGYEMREVMAEVKFFPKERKKRFYEKGTKRFIREDEMTGADFDLPLFKKSELDKTKVVPAPVNGEATGGVIGALVSTVIDIVTGKKKLKAKDRKAAATTAGYDVLEAIIQAANLQPKLEFDLSQALTEHVAPKALLKAWKKVAMKGKWDKAVADNLGKVVLAEGEKGMDAAIEVLRPFVVSQD